jgi:tetratricopeptide (TPR) repeat protein
MPADFSRPIDQLVGRSAEIDVVRQHLDMLGERRGSVLLFAGEPGIGKSTLARESAKLAAVAGIPVYWGFAWEAGGAPAYWPWTQLLRSLAAARELPAESLGPLAQILPEVSKDGERRPELQPDQARFQLLESVRVLLTEATRDAPMVFVLEDLHAADSDSLQLLHYVARHSASLPILVLGTYRVVEARSSSGAEPLWRTGRDATVLELGHLHARDVRDYLRLRGDTTPDDATVERLLAATAGNPLFLTELVGLLSRSGGSGDGDLELPDSVQQVIRQQMSLLPGETADRLGAAAVFGREFEPGKLSALLDIDERNCRDSLQSAIDAGLVKQTRDGNYRFSHTLHRDVLYGDLGAERREDLHLRCARQLQELVDAGDEDRWAAIARHLLRAGPERRLSAIGALQSAASRARERLALEDSAALLAEALAAFGDGPRYDPRQRCRLLVDCAKALMLVGDLETGQRHCKKAFSIAGTVGDPCLMSEVALAWGSAIVVAKIDRHLVAALEECLERLPVEDVAMRARIKARLAAAMQPARDPAVPMRMAREAIELARGTGDEQTLFQVLRFAISALMDFAPAEERIALNREFLAMTAAARDVPQQLRCNLRLMIDASEIGDRRSFDDAVAACEEVARRIDLPHYQWRAESARAMQATIDGDFGRAAAHLDHAQVHADSIDDLQAKVTLSIQRFALLVDWESPQATPLDAIEAQLQRAYDGGISDAEFFVAPFIAVYKQGDDAAFARQFVANTPFVERTFAGGDRYSLAGLGQMALKAGDTALAERCYDSLLAYRTGCATLGLMGSCWCGPVAYWLGKIAYGLGRLEEARDHNAEAIRIAEQMNARPYVARIYASAAEIASAAGDEADAARHAAQAQALMKSLSLRPVRMVPTGSVPPGRTETALSLQRDGDVWTVHYGAESATVRDARGLHMLAALLAEPDRDVHVLDLSGSPAAGDDSGSGPMLDAQARDEYRRRIGDLQEELEEAESLADIGRADGLRSEIDFITKELSRAFGLGGRKRRAGDATERARVNVRRRIKDAIERIREQAPDAGRYLENTIKTGRYCRYSPM